VVAHLHTVFIVEDDDLTRTSLVRRIAEAQAGLQVTTAVGSCREIRAALELTRPAVLLVDLGLPDGDGLDIIRETAKRWPGVLIMVITVFGDELKVVSSIKAGASGYCSKTMPLSESAKPFARCSRAARRSARDRAPSHPAFPPRYQPGTGDVERHADAARDGDPGAGREGLQLRRNRGAARPDFQHRELLHQEYLRQARRSARAAKPSTKQRAWG
jgi:DNA-binding NarL/FixJ family response regulator